MKIFLRCLASALFFVPLIFIVLSVGSCLTASYQWENSIGNTWSMMNKSSDLQSKYNYLTEFLSEIENASHAEYAAIFGRNTNECSFTYNLEALKTLKIRHEEVLALNPDSIEYQTGFIQINNILEIRRIISVLYECWMLGNGYWMAFDIWELWVWPVGFILIVLSVCFFFKSFDY